MAACMAMASVTTQQSVGLCVVILSLFWRLLQVWSIAAIEVLRQHLRSIHDYTVLGPTEVVSCTYHHWYKPSSKHQYQLPVFGRRVQRCPQNRLESHSLAIVHVVGRFANGHHVARADRVCMHCGALHMLLLQMSYMLLLQMICI